MTGSVNLKDHTGERHNSMTVVGRADEPKNPASWVCLCDCGESRVVPGPRLRKKKTLYCYKCWHGHPNDPDVAFRRFLHAYRTKAIWDGMEFTLSSEQVASITSSKCTYCGAEPSNVHTVKRRRGRPSSTYVYMGMDRVDSSGGYTPGNVVPCCRRCNAAKSDMQVDEFLAWARRVVSHAQTKEVPAIAA